MHYHKKQEQFVTPNTYDDMEGNVKTFTHIDYDKKLKIETSVMGDKEYEELLESIKKYKEECIQRILSYPAVHLVKEDTGSRFEKYIERSIETGITWREGVIKEVCMLNQYESYVIELMLWRNTVKFDYWWGPYLSHEEILAGKWKELM